MPVLSMLFRQMGAIPIAAAREDPARKAQALGQVRAALEAGEAVAIFPEGRLTDSGDMNAFRPGVEQILAATPVPVVPMALRGLWGSLFSRARGNVLGAWRRLFARVALVVAPPLPPREATAQRLFECVRALRGDAR
jgi:1-acyl-sn-glycerol-3-phosphate acyltransferase